MRLCFGNLVRASRKGIFCTHKQMNFRASCCVAWLMTAEEGTVVFLGDDCSNLCNQFWIKTTSLPKGSKDSCHFFFFYISGSCSAICHMNKLGKKQA